MTPKDPITLAIEALEYYSGQETYGFLHETDRAIQPLAALRTLQARPVPSAMPPDAMRSIAQIAFETHASFFDFSHPRMGMRTATWDELPEKSKQEWEEVARTVLASATASPDGYKSFDDLENERKAYRMGWDDGIASVGGDESPKTGAGDVEDLPEGWFFHYVKYGIIHGKELYECRLFTKPLRDGHDVTGRGQTIREAIVAARSKIGAT